MTDEEIYDIEKDATLHYGYDHQLLKLIEELGELSREAVKILLEEAGFGTDHFFEEWADVLILMDQMRIFLPKADRVVKYWYEKKLERLRQRMEEEASDG